MTKILIVTGSVYGTATLVGEDLQIALEKNGHKVHLQEGGSSRILEQEFDLVLICTSTTGSGDVPANLMHFHEELLSTPPRIKNLRYAVIALGDSSYGDTFCGAGRAIDSAMQDIGAVQISEPLLLDATETSSPEDEAIEWVENLLTNNN